jgi:hypothetical protein
MHSIKFINFAFFITLGFLSHNVMAENSFEQRISILKKELEQTKIDINNLQEQKSLNVKKIKTLNDEGKVGVLLYEKNKQLRKEKEILDRKTKKDLEITLAKEISQRDKALKESNEQAKNDEIHKIQASRMQLQNEKLRKHVAREDEVIDKSLNRFDSETDSIKAQNDMQKALTSRVKIQNDGISNAVKKSDEFMNRELKKIDAEAENRQLQSNRNILKNPDNM